MSPDWWSRVGDEIPAISPIKDPLELGKVERFPRER
jgi:hypothetical protein